VKERGRRTIVLCTHSLGEAESLCDETAILVNGSVRACGSPQRLVSHFGRDWRVDVLLSDTNRAGSVDEYLAGQLCGICVLFSRNKTRVYSVPCASIDLPSLFCVMQRAVDAGTGITCFTCASSALEKAFAGIVGA